MLSQEIIQRHAGLVDKMASALGLDLEEMMMMGQLDLGALGDAVLACTGCSNTEGCAHWLTMQNGMANQTPGMCRNADMFSELKSGHGV